MLGGDHQCPFTAPASEAGKVKALSTIRRANRIVVIENGKIAEQGTHAELLKMHGHYYRLYTQQFRHELETQYGFDEAVGVKVKQEEPEAMAAD